MNELLIYISSFAVGVFLLSIFWTFELGVTRGIFAAVARVGWITPIFLCFWPRSEVVETRQTIGKQTVHVFLDDSDSMKEQHPNLSTGGPKQLELVQSTCEKIGCQVKTKLLSELSEKTKDHYTPMNPYLTEWITQVAEEPWLVMSDGGDWRPQIPWVSSNESNVLGQSKGLIISFQPVDSPNNVAINSVTLPQFAFEESIVDTNIILSRSGDLTHAEMIQTQVLLGNQALRSINVTFQPGESKVDLDLKIPALQRGQHLLTFRILPSAQETIIWDNEVHKQLEVMPNTIGILHLLGAPSWDGRFLRRYLKSEPKYDLISFFILRDPWDQQQVNERELSLIPFPVERLFNEELPSFRVVIIQNFSLFQFLDPSLQDNLVQFVKNGGGVLFIGGPRALQMEDLTSSALVDILPFEPPKPSRKPQPTNPFLRFGRPKSNLEGPYYDDNLSFDISMANPDATSRELASVFDDWHDSIDQFKKTGKLKGLHHMEKVKFKENQYTPLLTATTDSNTKIPLAVASYPGKGRAIWVFSDQIWKIAMSKDQKIPRQTYNSYLESALSWLMRKEIQKPLLAKGVSLLPEQNGSLSWRVTLQGPAVKYFSLQKNWSLQLCGQVLDNQGITVKKLGLTNIALTGHITSQINTGGNCTLKIRAEHPAFGEITTSITGVIPETFHDSETISSHQKLQDLANITGADILDTRKPNSDSQLEDWLLARLNSDGVALPKIQSNRLNYFWPLDTWWIWLTILLLPIEVLLRRWHMLTRNGS